MRHVSPESAALLHGREWQSGKMIIAMEEAGKALAYEFEPVLAEALDLPVELSAYRGTALVSLLGWLHLERYFDRALSMLARDPEPEARGQAADAIGRFVLETSVRRDEALGALGRAALIEADAYVVRESYQQYVWLTDPTQRRTLLPFADYLKDTGDDYRARHVDVDQLEKYRPH